MPKKPDVFSTTRSGSVRAAAKLRQNQDGTIQSPAQAIPDGDTLGVHIDGSGAVRFLGIDTPEKSFRQPLGGASSLDGAPWADYLADPFAPGLGEFELEPDLKAHINAKAAADAGANHHRHGRAAELALTTLVEQDMTVLGQTREEFGFHLSFSHEVFDTFGRFLCFINRDQPVADDPEPRPLSYNERLLELGVTLPYFIWPNTAPFRDARTIVDAIVEPGGGAALGSAGALGRARQFVQDARANRIGVFSAADPLVFEAFEIRYLGRGSAPSRAVIDLSKEDNVILRPQNYFKIANPEDRLFIPREYVYAFTARGWKLEGWS